jgi:hypothetical protein
VWARLTSLWEDTLSDDVSEFLQGHIGVLAAVLWIVDEEAIPLLAAVPQNTQFGYTYTRHQPHTHIWFSSAVESHSSLWALQSDNVKQILTNYKIGRETCNKTGRQTERPTDPRSFLFLRMGLLTELSGLRLMLRSCILMLASCSAWACWIPATIAWQRERELAGDRKGHKAKCYTMNI